MSTVEKELAGLRLTESRKKLDGGLAQKSHAHMPSSSSVLLINPVMSVFIAVVRFGQSWGKRWVTT